MAATKKPTGLTIKRNDNKFTLSWKKGDKNYGDGQAFQYKLTGDKKWRSVSIGKTTTSKAVSVALSKFFPHKAKKLKSIQMRVRGNRDGDYTVSDWAEKTMSLKVPHKPSLSVTLNSQIPTESTFHWSEKHSSSDTRPFDRIVWQSRLAKESNVAAGKKLTWKSGTLGWQKGTGNASGSKVITEDSASLANASYTRWFRVRAEGPAGASDWVYKKHTYAQPYQAIVSKIETKETTSGYYVKIVWASTKTAAHPIDKTVVNYSIAVPDADLECPAGASWTEVQAVKDTKGNDALAFYVTTPLDDNECLFVRVDNYHDSKVTPGIPKLARVGNLATPTNVSVSVSGNNATISATNAASAVPDSFLVVRFTSNEDPKGFDIGIIPHGSSSVTVTCPALSGLTYAFEVYAAVGEYEETERADGITSYAVTALMRSVTEKTGGAVPLAPENVALSATNKPGTIQVTWDWSWDGATAAELSWADHDDAWESTDEPDTYLVSNINASRWNISGLETGLTWYVRVRLIAQNGEEVTAGPWSDIQSIDLSSAPVVPVLELSDAIITETGQVTATWAYTTTDGTGQSYAEVDELIIDGGDVTYEKLAEVETQQSVTIRAEDVGWGAGETHELVVRVVSASGRQSDDWSDPVAVTVADQMTCEIEETSLESQSIVVNPRTFTGNPVEFDTDSEEIVTELEVALTPTQLGSGTPSPSNVRPIVGNSSVAVEIDNGEDTIEVEQNFNVTLTPTVIDETPYLFKKTGDIRGDRESLEIVGGTVNWNQLVRNGNFADGTSNWGASIGVGTGTLSAQNNELTYTVTSVGPSYWDNGINHFFLNEIPAGHIMYISGEVNPPHAGTITLGIRHNSVGVSGAGVTKSAQANVWNKYERVTVSQSTSITDIAFMLYASDNGYSVGDKCKFRNIHVTDLTAFFANSSIASYVNSLTDNITWLRKYFPDLFAYSPYNTGTLKSVKPTAHVTRGVNQWDEEWEVGAYNTTTGAKISGNNVRSKNMIRIVPNTVYRFTSTTTTSSLAIPMFFYDGNGEFVSYILNSVNATFATPSNAQYMTFYCGQAYGTTYNHDICINISDSNLNGKYYPADHHSYPITELELRGIPKLVDGKLQFDGDEYLPDGTVNRRYGVVDLGSLSWAKDSSANFFSSQFTLSTNNSAAICAKYVNSGYISTTSMVSGQIQVRNNYIFIYDNSYTDATTFKSAMSGVYLVYEKVTPTTETADPFTDPQEVSIYGTEEFVSSNGVPVGNKTTYKTRDIFGGKIDLVSGVLTVDMVMDDLSLFTWNESGTYLYFSNSISSVVKKPADDYTVANVVFEKYNTVARNSANNKNDGAITSDGKVVIRNRDELPSGHICYELATPLTYQLTPHEIETLIGSNVVTTEDGNLTVSIAESMRDILALTEMPLEVTVTGAGDGGTTRLVIARAQDYHVERPDETDFNGFENETIALLSQTGEDTFVIDTDDLIGKLDDEADYRIIATTQDGFGQSAEQELDFEVHWDHQAIVPTASAEIDTDNLIAVLTPTAPTGTAEGDTCDIYRLSVDRPVLVYQGAQFGEDYVDPYPTLGNFGGYRFVFMTSNGDYITADHELAWVDVPTDLDVIFNIIDFDGGQVRLIYDINLNNSWTKDFAIVKYMGGSVEGYWNPAVERSANLDGMTVVASDPETIQSMRRLATHTGPCHIRTKDGSSYTANVEVTENYSNEKSHKIAEFTMKISCIDPQGFDGLTYDEWLETQQEA